ncbi:FtsX-like permease family protein [Roseivirga sp.]|uniref:FtsX-like permease family protein n=1 Tax=Roseivirga sp. TaxID=1964215 RepID=UPI003B51901A
MSSLKPTYEPPRLAAIILSWFCKDRLLEEIEGDLFEYYQMERENRSRWLADLHYWFHLFNFLRPFALKKFGQNSNNVIMLKSHFIIARRVILKDKFYSFLNILGLTLGISASLFIFLYVRDEYSFDKYNKDYDQIYRVITDFKVGDREMHWPISPAFLAEHLEKTVPEVESAGRLMGGRFDSVIDLDEKQLQIKNAGYATSEILSMFTIPFVEGNPEGALDDPKTAVISESMAQHLFPNEDALNKTVAFNSDQFIIKGIFKDMPENGHIKYDFIMSAMYQDSRFAENWSWTTFNSYTYIKLRANSSQEFIEEKLNETLASLMTPAIQETWEIDASDIQANGNHARFYLQPLADIHLKSHLDREIMPNGSMATVKTVSIIGLIIILIASINFINLSTARAAVRGKEVGVRKVIGSQRRQLIHQFLFESTMFSVLSFLLSAGIVFLALPYFNQLVDKNIVNPFGGTIPLWFIMIMAAVILGVLAGLYPALLLSSFKPIKTLKGQNQLKSGNNWFRGSLVVLQFTISTILIIATLVVNDQLNFVTKKTLGYDKDNVLTIDVMDLNRYQPGSEALRNEFLSRSNVESISLTGYTPVSDSRLEMYLKRKEAVGIDEAITSQAWPVPEDYISTWGMSIVEGSDFNDKISSDSAISVILNETAVSRLQLADPVNSYLTMTYGSKSWDIRVIGVVKDFHFASMKENIKPLFLYKSSDPWTLAVRFNGSPAQAMATAEQIWAEHSGGQPFLASLVSEKYSQLYSGDNRMKDLVNAFSGLAIVVAIIGLFGLSTFMAEQRKKEMGIRKVLGANAGQLFLNLLKNFTLLILVSCVVAIPLAYLITENWLNEFAYRISLSPFFFIAATVLMLALAWITVSYQSFMVAIRNPVKNLHNE